MRIGNEQQRELDYRRDRRKLMEELGLNRITIMPEDK